MKVTTIGIDIAKNVFQVHGVDEQGRVVLRKALRRAQMMTFFSNLPPCLIGMEACGSAHYWARVLMGQGHRVKLMPAQYVKPYVKGNKRDPNDAAGICEAVTRPSMRFVSINTVEQQDLQMLHRIRSRLVADRSALCNQTRGLLAEYGLVFAQGPGALRRGLPEVLEDAENGLSGNARELIADQLAQLKELDRRVSEYDARIDQACAERDTCRRLLTIPGIGPKTATALVAAVNDARDYTNGRALAASLGLTPREHSSGEKQTFLGITKRGNRYLRTLLIHGARTVLRHAPKRRERGQADTVATWALNLSERRHLNIAAVALANKNVRIAWALLTRQQSYQALPQAA